MSSILDLPPDVREAWYRLTNYEIVNGKPVTPWEDLFYRPKRSFPGKLAWRELQSYLDKTGQRERKFKKIRSRTYWIWRLQ